MAPTILIAGGNATATATAVTSAQFTGGGSGYLFPPIVTVSAPTGPNPVQATAAAVLTGGVVTGITLTGVLTVAAPTTPGTGYSPTNPPTLQISGGGGSGATAGRSSIRPTARSPGSSSPTPAPVTRPRPD